MATQKLKVLAISSGGGHWVQLLRLRPALEGCHVIYATVKSSYRADIGEADFRVIPDSSRWSKLAMLHSAWAIFWLLVKEQPDVILSTGAAPGYFGVRLGKWLGARTVWIDSVANAEELSMSGQKAAACTDLWLTQWPHLARNGGPQYMGSVL